MKNDALNHSGLDVLSARSGTALPVAERLSMTRNRPLPMATDGQGVILAVPHSVDPRQRAAIDLLSRRVSHRLGCPTSPGQVQRGTLHVDAPLAELHAKGAREVVVAPLTLSDQTFDYSTPTSRSLAGARFGSVSLRNAGSLGGVAEVVSAVLESLALSERSPDPHTRVVLLLPFHDRMAQARTRAAPGTVHDCRVARRPDLFHATREQQTGSLPSAEFRLRSRIPPRALGHCSRPLP